MKSFVPVLLTFFTLALSLRAGTLDATYTRPEPGAVPQTLKSWLDDSPVRVEGFGAKGDGVTDDSTAFQLAVNTGRSIQLAAKTYRLAGNVVVPTGVHIFGQGIGKTVIRLDNSVDGFLSAANFTGFHFFTIRGTNPKNLGGTGVALGNGATATGNTCNLESVEFQFLACGLYTGYYDGVSARNCVFHGNTNNLRVEANVGPMQLTDCIVNDAISDGIVLTNGANLLMSGGNLNNNGMGGTGSAISGETSTLVCRGVQFEGVGGWAAGSTYVRFGFNSAVTITECAFQDGYVEFYHVSCANHCIVSVDRCTVSNAPTGGPWLFGTYVFDARSTDGSLRVRNNGALDYKASPWHTYLNWETLPTADELSEPIYTLATWSGVTGTTELHTFIKRQTKGVWSYQQID